MAFICFSHWTSLRVLADFSVFHQLAEFEQTEASLPRKAATEKDIETAYSELQTLCPPLSIDEPFHCIISKDTRLRKRTDSVTHICSTRLPSGSLVAPLFDSQLLLCSPALSFVQIAAQEDDFIKLLEVGYEICGTYRTGLTSSKTDNRLAPLVSIDVLQNYVKRVKGIRGTCAAKRAIPYIAGGSESPRESKLAILLGLPQKYGGYGLGIPHLNYTVIANEIARDITGRNSFRLDLCWPSKRIGVEYQSRERHSDETARIRDADRTHALNSMGWTIVHVTNKDLDRLKSMDVIAQNLKKALEIRNRVRVDDYRMKQLQLRERLNLNEGFDYEKPLEVDRTDWVC